VNLFVAEPIQIPQHFWAEGSTFTRSTRMSAGGLLIFQSALIELSDTVREWITTSTLYFTVSICYHFG